MTVPVALARSGARSAARLREALAGLAIGLNMIDVLVVSIEEGRFGPPRLPQSFVEAGLSVAALCSADNLLLQSGFLTERHILPQTRSFRGLAAALVDAIAANRPRIVIPGDGQTFVLLQEIAQGRGGWWVPATTRAVISASLGDPHQYGASRFKSETIALARSIGLPVPVGATVQSADDAVAQAERIGFPVFVKQSLGWSGHGVTRCVDARQVRAAFVAGQIRFPRLRAIERRVRGLDWYPLDTPIDVQKAVPGSEATFCALAWGGRLVAGMCGTRIALACTDGPGLATRLGHSPEMAGAAGRMIEALGLTGFVAFDFIVPDDGGLPVLLSCNPRPVSIIHPGPTVGVNFAAMLAHLLARGKVPEQPVFATCEADVMLFPHSFDSKQAEQAGWLPDLPSGEPGPIDRAVGRKGLEQAVAEQVA